MSDTPEAIRTLAEACARKGLRLRQSRALFDQLYIADAVSVTGSIARAADLAGMERPALMRAIGRGRLDLDP